jgi:hypothetical protein
MAQYVTPLPKDLAVCSMSYDEQEGVLAFSWMQNGGDVCAAVRKGAGVR